MVNLNKLKEEKSIKELLEFSVINIDKPAGPTSFGVDSIVKRSIDANKVSHFGTLDPMVTGVLPLALNRACRLMSYFIGKNKTYVGIMRLHEDKELNEINKEIKNFIGEIKQLPPKKSSVKRQERTREIFTFKILEKNNKDILFETEVEAGTYIRKLVHDIGEKLGGAHMLELRRTQASIFKEQESYNLYDFTQAVEEYKKGNEKPIRDILIPGEIISKVLPVIEVKVPYMDKLYHGSPLLRKYLKGDLPSLDIGQKIAIFNHNQFIGVFSLINNKETKDQNQALAKAEFILQPIKQ